MKFLSAFALVAVAASYNWQLDPNLGDHWDTFKRVYGKQYYDWEDEMARRAIWEKSIARISQHNLKADMDLQPFTMGINKYSDLGTNEFIERFNGARTPDVEDNSTYRGSAWVPPSHMVVPEKLDWRDHGLVTPVKDQQECNSCWAFSATGSLEGQQKKKTGRLVSLSEQDLIDCSQSSGNNGCVIGYLNEALEHVMKNKGIDTESSYPYTARVGNCRFSRVNVGATCTGFVALPQGNETYLKLAVASAGPVSVLIDANHDQFIHYRSDIYYQPACSSTSISHAALIVGYGTEGGEDYWLVKNSWGTSWGIDGYIKMARNRDNNCAIATYASYPMV